MSTVEQHNERLTIEKAQLRQVAESRLGVLGAAAVLFGKEQADGFELRLTKAQLAKIAGRRVAIRELKRGGLVVEVTELE